jgi:hypothetical protein
MANIEDKYDVIGGLDTINESVEDVGNEVRALQGSVQKLHETVKDRSGWLQSIGAVVVVVWLLSLAGDLWHSKWRYAVQYGVDAADVIVQKKLHDCEFLSAPVGDKQCHYDVSVSTIQWSTSSSGAPIQSYDEGKTWESFSPDPAKKVPRTPTVQSVFVVRTKIDE